MGMRHIWDLFFPGFSFLGKIIAVWNNVFFFQTDLAVKLSTLIANTTVFHFSFSKLKASLDVGCKCGCGAPWLASNRGCGLTMLTSWSVRSSSVEKRPWSTPGQSPAKFQKIAKMEIKRYSKIYSMAFCETLQSLFHLHNGYGLTRFSHLSFVELV